MENYENLMSYDMADYIECTEDSEGIELCGVGFNSFKESPNAQESEKQYINQKSSTTSVTGYKPEFAVDLDVIASEKAVMEIVGIGKRHETGAKAQRNIYRVELFNPVDGEEKEFVARKQLVSVVVSDNLARTGGEVLTSTATLKAVGDQEFGKFNVETNKFTADDSMAKVSILNNKAKLTPIATAKTNNDK